MFFYFYFLGFRAAKATPQPAVEFEMKMGSVHTTGLCKEGVHGMEAVVRVLVAQVVEQRTDLGWDLHII